MMSSCFLSQNTKRSKKNKWADARRKKTSNFMSQKLRRPSGRMSVVGAAVAAAERKNGAGRGVEDDETCSGTGKRRSTRTRSTRPTISRRSTRGSDAHEINKTNNIKEINAQTRWIPW